jgi:cell division protease FtsH
MLREAEKKAVGVLKEHRDVLDQLVQLLLAHETVDGSAVYALAHRPEPTDADGMTVAPAGAASLAGNVSVASSEEIPGLSRE